MDLDLQVDTDALRRGLSDLARRQLPFALRLASNRTIRTIKPALQAMLRRVLRSPSRWTLNSMYLRFATRKDMAAVIAFREFAGKGVAAGKYLRHMETGGPRAATRFEISLRLAGVIGPDEYVVGENPILGGGPTRGGYTRALSQFRAIRAGIGNASDTARSRRSRRRGGTFFVPKESGLGLGEMPRAIYVRRGGVANVVWWIVRGAPHYRRTLRFRETTNRVAEERFPEEFERALAEAIRTAR